MEIVALLNAKVCVCSRVHAPSAVASIREDETSRGVFLEVNNSGDGDGGSKTGSSKGDGSIDNIRLSSTCNVGGGRSQTSLRGLTSLDVGMQVDLPGRLSQI